MAAEKALDNKIIAYVRSQGGKAIKLNIAGVEMGTPDILGSIPYEGRWIPFLVEDKAPGKYPSPIQTYRIEEWGARGFVTGFVSSLEDFKNLIAGGSHDT